MTELISSGPASGLMTQLIVRAALVYPTEFEALSEYIQNAFDANATQIWITLDHVENRITILDNGEAMGGSLPPDDRQIVELFYQIVNDGQTPGCDLRDVVSEVGTHTLEWTIKNIANSIKAASGGKSNQPNKRLAKYLKAAGKTANRRSRKLTFGKFGVGAWAFLRFAHQMLIISRPNPSLAQALGLSPTNPPVYVLMPPTATMLENFQLAYELYETDDPINDPQGEALAHGTLVVLNDIKPEAWDTLNFDDTMLFLRDSFGTRLRQGGVAIYLADEDRSEPVQPQAVKGHIILDTSFETIDGTENRIFLHYNPKGRNLVPAVNKLGMRICSLADVHQGTQIVFGGVLIGGTIGGYITYEHHNREGGDDNLFDTSKRNLVDAPERRFWISRVKSFEPQIKQAIEAIDRAAQDERLNQSRSILSTALQAALTAQGISLFGPDQSSEEPQTTRLGKKHKKTRLEHIIVNVVNKSAKGVPQVTVHVEGPHKTFTKETGVSGTVQFAHPIPGTYTVVLETVHPVLTEVEPFVINHKEGVYGKRIRFVVDTGEKEDAQIDNPEIDVAFSTWDDPGEVWRQNIRTMGVIEFNIAPNTNLRTLLDYEHYETSDAIMAEGLAAAVKEALKEGGMHPDRISQSQLFISILRRVREQRSEGTRTGRRRS